MPLMDPTRCAVCIAGADDLLSILRVHSDADVVEASDRERDTWARMMATTDLTVYLAEVEGEAVGTATVVLLPNITYECAPTAFVEAVVVNSRYRRRGIASLILRRILSDTRSEGCNKVQLLSHKRHATDGAHALYTSLGFEAEAEGFRLYHSQIPDAVLAAKS
jgi:GNAT superfamily N-acetyltransferase